MYTVYPKTSCVHETVPISPGYYRVKPVPRLLYCPPVQLVTPLQSLQCLYIDQIVEQEGEHLRAEVKKYWLVIGYSLVT